MVKLNTVLQDPESFLGVKIHCYQKLESITYLSPYLSYLLPDRQTGAQEIFVDLGHREVCSYSCTENRSCRILTFSLKYMHLMNPPQFFIRLLELFLWKANKHTQSPILCLSIVIKMRLLPFPGDGLEPLLYSSGIDHYCSTQDIPAKSENIIFH